MFKNRELKVTVEKKNKGEDNQSTTMEPRTFEEKAACVLKFAQAIGIRVFAGVVIYVALDTVRQVAVENVKYDR